MKTSQNTNKSGCNAEIAAAFIVYHHSSLSGSTVTFLTDTF